MDEHVQPRPEPMAKFAFDGQGRLTDNIAIRCMTARTKAVVVQGNLTTLEHLATRVLTKSEAEWLDKFHPTIVKPRVKPMHRGSNILVCEFPKHHPLEGKGQGFGNTAYEAYKKMWAAIDIRLKGMGGRG